MRASLLKTSCPHFQFEVLHQVATIPWVKCLEEKYMSAKSLSEIRARNLNLEIWALSPAPRTLNSEPCTLNSEP